MTTDQAIVFAILGGLLVLFVWDRFRYDLVALAGLAIAIAAGVVAPDKAFLGFGDDIVIIIGSALVVSAAVARSGIAETLLRPIAPWMTSTEVQIVVLVTLVAVLSAFMKNIGALAIFVPIAFQIARRSGKPASRLLMPMSFGALLGGLMTLIGTSPNIIVSRMRAEILGEPFRMFDFMPVGLALTAIGIAFLTFGWRLLPRSREGTGGGDLFSVEDYLTEVTVPAGSPMIGKTVADLEALAEGEVTVAAIIREKFRRYEPMSHWVLFEGDVLVLQCDARALEALAPKAKLELVHDATDERAERDRPTTVVEAVVSADSPLIGRTVEDLRLRDRYGVSVLALSRRGSRVATRLNRARFQSGDLLVLRGAEDRIGDSLAALNCLPLAERQLRLGERNHPLIAPAVLAVAMALAATGTASVAVAFFGAAVAILVLGALSLREAYETVEWPILVLLGALIPISEAMRATGGADLIAGWLSVAAQALPPPGALALVMVAAMAVTPFLNNAATVLVMAPIGAGLAQRLGLAPDPFLMAVALGAACDFLTPIGHQCNTLVMGPGGYRFGDYWRLGLPLSVIVVAAGVPLIMAFWPLG
ncbi:MAG: SLC13 family permease [Rhodospirillales bacterium]